jgi:hypothetical protein
MQSANYDIESKKVLDAHKKRLAEFNSTYPIAQYYAEKHLTMLIPNVWDTMVQDLDYAPPHTRRECPGAPARK